MNEYRGLWRGKRADTNEWIAGYLMRGTDIVDCTEIAENSGAGCRYDVIPETLGECTGLCDRQGTPIFEGDIVEYDNRICEINYIEWLAMFDINPVGGKRDQESTLSKVISPDMRVIGNIHDNPELLTK